MKNYRMFLQYYKNKSIIWLLIIDLIAACFVALFSVCVPYITKFVIDKALPNTAQTNMTAVWYAFGLYGALFIIRIFAGYIVTFRGHDVGIKIEVEMRRSAHEKLLKLSMSEFETRNSGGFISRIVTDLKDVAEFAHHAYEDLLMGLVTFAGGIVFAFIQNTMMGYFLIGVVIVGSLLTYLIAKKWKVRWKYVKEKTSVISSSVAQQVSNVGEIKASTIEKEMEKVFALDQKMYTDEFKKFFKLEGHFTMLNAFIVTMTTIVTLIVGVVLLNEGKITQSQLAGLTAAAAILNQPMQKFAAVYTQFSSGMSSIGRFNEFMEWKEEVSNDKELKVSDGAINFKNIHFSYGEENRVVINDFNLNIKGGESVAFVGKTGIGKSTILKLLLGFYPDYKGVIEIDGQDIKDASLESLRNQVSYVQQQPAIFDNTIEFNIRLGKPNATEEELEKAIDKARVRSIIDNQQKGIKELVGTNGAKLSGGEKQRIAIARVFLRDSSIVLFDEATSAIDNSTEKLIQQATSAIAKGRTMIIVAHRLSTIKWVDRIIVLGENGKILEEGTYEELEKKDGSFTKLLNGEMV